MQIASSASCTCRDWTSASEYTASVLMPSSRHARTIRSAISPRLAMRIFWIIGSATARPIAPGCSPWRNRQEVSASSALLQLKEPLAVFHRLAVFHQDLQDGALRLRLYLVHDLHRLDDADQRVLLYLGAQVHEGLTLRRGRPVEGPDHGRLYVDDPRFLRRGRRPGYLDRGWSRNRRDRVGLRDERGVGSLWDGRDQGLAIGSPSDLQLEALLLDRELREFRSFHQVDDLFDLF